MSDHRPLRLALVTDAIYPYHHGGKEMRTHELAQRLARHADVHVYTMKWWTGARVRTHGGVTFHGIAPRLPLYVRGRRSIVQAIVFAIGCAWLAVARFDALEADHIPYWQLIPLRVITFIRRKRFVVTWHESWGAEYWRSYLGAAGVFAWWFERFTMRLPDAIIAASAHTAARLVDLLGPGADVTVAPNGIDLSKVHESPASTLSCDLVCVGRLLSHKRVDLLIDAVAQLRDAGEMVTCRVIGDGPERSRLEAQARRLGVHEQVELGVPVATPTELFSQLKAARVFVFPSQREGFGIAALEALACGLPVITTSAEHNMAQHLVNRSSRGIVCEPTLGCLTEAIRSVLASDEAPEVDESWISEFDWDSIARCVSAVMVG